MNQITLDDNTLKELGLDGFSESDKNAILKRIYEALELRIGARIAQKVSEEELKRFTEMTEQGKDEEAAKWLKEQVPEYQEIAGEELDKIKQEIKDTSRKVMENTYE